MLLLSFAWAGPVVDGDTAPAFRIADGKGVATMLLESGEAALTRLDFEDGATVPPHVHETSAEILYVLEGRAEMTVAGEKVVVEKGDAVRIPAGVEHSAKVTGSLRAVQVYAGPGPEQRFKKGEALKR